MLKSCKRVAEQSTMVRVLDHKIRDVAEWMAYEEFKPPDGSLLFDFGNDADVIMDFILVTNTINLRLLAFRNRGPGSSFRPSM